MTEHWSDPLASLLSPTAQIEAARWAQDGFSHAFRLTLETSTAERPAVISQAARKLEAWVGTDDLSALRLGLLLSGLDQWGLAYSQVFGPDAMQGLSELVNILRNPAHSHASEALEIVERINDEETSAASFKAELRKAIHLALWHAMIEEADREEALAILQQLGGMMLALVKRMPELGWIITANTLADIQIRCLAHGLAATGIAQEVTEKLFDGLNKQLPAEQRGKIMEGATRTVIAWQQSQRPGAEALH